MTEILIYECPWCSTSIEISSMNCMIFRCGVYKDNLQQVPPHMPQVESEKLGDSIWGCGKPFQFHNDKLIKCGWI